MNGGNVGGNDRRGAIEGDELVKFCENQSGECALYQLREGEEEGRGIVCGRYRSKGNMEGVEDSIA